MLMRGALEATSFLMGVQRKNKKIKKISTVHECLVQSCNKLLWRRA